MTMIICSFVSTAFILAISFVVAPSAQSNREQAKVHYEAALVALKQSDLAGAEQELLAAQQLDDSNPLIYYSLAVVQKNSSPDDALTNLGRAEAIGLPPGEKKTAMQLRPQIVYEVGKARRMFEGVWLWSEQVTSKTDTAARTVTWTFEVSGLNVFGRTKMASHSVNNEPDVGYQCVQSGSRQIIDRAWSSDLSVVFTKPRQVKEASKATFTCTATCCTDSDWSADSYRITSQTDEELKVLRIRTGEILLFRKQ
jgi:hypothetical protein